MDISVTINETQVKLLDRVVSEGAHGGSRAEVLRAILKEHVGHLLTGGDSYDMGGVATLEIKLPEYGASRFDQVFQASTGKAIPVYKGEVLRFLQVVGGQCVDFNAYSLHDYKEYLDCGYNRMKGMSTGKGTIVWTGSPRARPMYAILECSETCDQYYAGHRCNANLYEREYDLTDHPNCQDTFAESIREYGLTPDDVHDSYNFWMHTVLDASGIRHYPMNRGQVGDYVDLLALFDTLAVPVVCSGDLSAVNSFDLQPMRFQVFDPSPATQAVVEQIQQRFGNYRTQATIEDFRNNQVLAQRELRPDLTYRPEFRPVPKKMQIDMSISAEEKALLESMIRTGKYGPSKEKALVITFLKWYEANRPTDRFIRLQINN